MKQIPEVIKAHELMEHRIVHKRIVNHHKKGQHKENQNAQQAGGYKGKAHQALPPLFPALCRRKMGILLLPPNFPAFFHSPSPSTRFLYV